MIICKLCLQGEVFPKGKVSEGTRLHDSCWELDKRVRDDPNLAHKILNQLQAEAIVEALIAREKKNG